MGARAILMYHSIDSSGSAISIDEEVFRGHVEWLASGTVRVTSLTGLLSLSPAEDAVAITFDDAFENFGSIAWPLLREHGLPVTVYVVTGGAGGTSAWNRPLGLPELPLLDWDALARLGEEGVELGSHTQSHPRLPALDGDQLQEEVVGSARIMEQRTGRTPTAFAYPYGAVDGRSEDSVRSVYQTACGTRLAMLDEEPPVHRLPRLDSYYFRKPGRLEGWGSARFMGYLGLRGAARSLRSRLESGRTTR